MGYIEIDCWGELERVTVGSYVWYKMGTEKGGEITEISGDRAKVNGIWFHASDLWCE